MPDMAVGIYSWALVVDHQQHTAQLVGQNVEDAWGWLNQQEAIKPSEVTDFALTSPWRSNMSYTAYQDKFARVQDYLRSGDCYQINLAQRFQAHYTGSEWQAYLKLEKGNQAPFSAFCVCHKAQF